MIKFHERIRNSKASKIFKKNEKIERGREREKHDEKLCLSDLIFGLFGLIVNEIRIKQKKKIIELFVVFRIRNNGIFRV